MKLSKAQKKIVADYGHLFNNTGGNDIVELIERDVVELHALEIAAELQGCCYSQVLLILQLQENGLLKEVS